MIAAQHFATELRRKNGCHTQTAPFLEICLKDGMLPVRQFLRPLKVELPAVSSS